MSRKLRSLTPLLSILAILALVLTGCGGDKPAQPGNHTPVARAGTDQTVRVGGTALLIGGGTDEDPDDALTYAWILVAKPLGSNAVIVTPLRATASFVADSAGAYVALLAVSDGRLSGSDEVTITAIPVVAP